MQISDNFSVKWQGVRVVKERDRETVFSATENFERFLQLESKLLDDFRFVYRDLVETLKEPRRVWVIRFDNDVIIPDYWRMLERYLKNKGYKVDVYISNAGEIVFEISL